MRHRAVPPFPPVRAPSPPPPSPAPPLCRAHRPRRPPGDVFLVDLDAFFVSVERVRNPSLRGRPVVVGGGPGDRGVVACASYEARAFGVRAGMPLARAAALLPAETRFVPGHHAAYAAASRTVLDLLFGFTPRVEAVSLDEAYLDMGGLDRHHRSCLDAARKMHATVLETTGLTVSIGIGATRAVAKIAASLAKPSGVVEVRRGEERAFLAALPIEVLPGVGPRLRLDLARFNLHTVGDLAEVPEEVLQETFGAGGVVLSRRARGIEAAEDEVPVGDARPRTRSISRETSFAHDTDDPALIDGMLSYLAQRATKALRGAGFLARSVGVRIRYADFKTVEARRRLPRPSDIDDEILGIVSELWRQRYDRRVRLRLVGVVLHDLVSAADRQLALPFPSSPRRSHVASPVPLAERIDRTVDVVRDRHGFGSLVRGRALELVGRLPRSSRGFGLHTPACSR